MPTHSNPGDEAPGHPPTAELPPVHPPTAGLIVQLFGIPLGLVAVAVLVWLLFGKIASSHRTADDYLADLRSTNFERRWSAARDLASILPRNQEWQNDQEFAAKLADEFLAELAKGERGPTEVRYLHYIAEVLGEFNSKNATPALRAALQPEVERDIREAAVMGMGRLADRLGQLDDADAVHALVAATRDDDPVIRVKAVWVLGRTNHPVAVDRLVPALQDSDPEVRHNAAASLARLGSTASLETLSEMLDLDSVHASLAARKLPEPKIQSQLQAIPLSAIQSLIILLEKKPDTNLLPLRPQLEILTQKGGATVRTRARELLQRIETGTHAGNSRSS